MNSIAGEARGALLVVATPIGNLADLSPRARDVLASADLLLAEDTRHTRQLLAACGIERPPGTVESLHDHNERERVPGLVARMAAGARVALVSDAGSPLVSDPGAALVNGAASAGIEIVTVPGPCAAIAALTVAALPAARFAFEGFLPARTGARRRALEELALEPRTLVFYEAPHRLREALEDLAAVLGETRPAAIARELTKRFESVYRGTLGSLARLCAADADMSKGEIVVVVRGNDVAVVSSLTDADRVLRVLLEELPAARAAKLAAQLTGRSRRELYERAMALHDRGRPAPDAD